MKNTVSMRTRIPSDHRKGNAWL